MFRQALSRAEERRDQRMMVAAIRAFYRGNGSASASFWLWRQAGEYLGRGFTGAAIAVAAMIPPEQARLHPLASAAKECDIDKVRFWRAHLQPGHERSLLAAVRLELERRPAQSPDAGCPAVQALLAY